MTIRKPTPAVIFRELMALGRALGISAATVMGCYVSITSHWDAAARAEVRAAVHAAAAELRAYPDSLHQAQAMDIANLADLTLFCDLCPGNRKRTHQHE